MAAAPTSRVRQLVESLQSDLLVLAGEKKKPAVKMSAERALLRLRGISAGKEDTIIETIAKAGDILTAFLVGLEETKAPKIFQISISCLHRLIENAAVDSASFDRILEILNSTKDANVEDAQVLRCLLLLVSRGNVAGPHLAQIYALCMHYYTSRDSNVITAAALGIMRQITSLVYDRISHLPPGITSQQALRDACNLFEDFCLLMSNEKPRFLKSLHDIPTVLGLELLESALAQPQLFQTNAELGALVKQRLVPLLLRLCSPPTKLLSGKTAPVIFASFVRSLRLVAIVVRHFSQAIPAECETFLVLLFRLVEADKPLWQRLAALEALQDLCNQPDVLMSLFQRFDCSPEGTKVVGELAALVSTFIQCLYQQSSNPEKLQPAVITSSKSILFEALEKNDSPPVISDSVALFVGFSCLVSIVRSMAQMLPSDSTGTVNTKDETALLVAKMIDATRDHVLTALTVLLRMSTVKQTIDAILGAWQAYVKMCCLLNASAARQDFILALCQFAVPDQFVLSSDSHSRPVQVSDKNLECAHQVVNMAKYFGYCLGQSWRPILSAVQQLSAIVDLSHPDRARVIGGRGSVGQSIASTSTNASEIPVLAIVLHQIFETSAQMSDDTLIQLIQGLCAVSEQTLVTVPTASAGAYLFRNSAHLFAVNRILEVGIGNLFRIMVFWPTVTAHLIEVAQCPETTLRESGTNALTRLVHAALTQTCDPPIQDSPGLQQAILSPLRNLALCPSADVHRKQLECVRQVLDSCGPSLSHAWPVVMNIINDALKATSPPPDVSTLRMAFDCIELVVNDFLHTVPLPCFLLLLDILGEFGLQRAAVNISLSAIGLLWNITDFISRHHQSISDNLAAMPLEDGPYDADGLPTHVSSKSLWMALFQRIAELCVDPRPEIRKSACQTLFSTLTTHGGVFSNETWQAFLWQILFKLLEKVQQAAADSCGAVSPPATDGMLVHHSRDTAEKQWAETRVLMLNGVGKVVVAFHARLAAMPDHTRAWALLLEFVQQAAQDRTLEVAIAAVLALQEIFRAPSTSGQSNSEVWAMSWQTWLQLAAYCPKRPTLNNTYTTALLDAIVPLYRFLYPTFTGADARRLLGAVRVLLCIPHQDALIVTQMSDIQQAALRIVLMLLPSEQYPDSDPSCVPLVLDELAVYVSFACECPTPVEPARPRTKLVYVNMALAAEEHAITLITKFCDSPSLPLLKSINRFLQVLSLPITLKYQSPTVQYWRASLHTAAATIELAARAVFACAREDSTSQAFTEMVESFWIATANVFELAFFTPPQVPADLSAAERVADAALNNELLHVLQTTVLPAALDPLGPVVLPSTHLLAMCNILKRGATRGIAQLDDAAPESVSHEAFSQACMQTLLSSPSLSLPGVIDIGRGLADSIAGILNAFGDDPGAAAIPKRVRECVFTIKACSAFVTREHRALGARIFPALARLITAKGPELRDPLRATIELYAALLDQ